MIKEHQPLTNRRKNKSLLAGGGGRLNGNGPQPVSLLKESEQFQSIDSNVIHISVLFLSFCCQRSVSMSFWLARDKRLLLILPIQSGPPPLPAVQEK